MVRAVAMSDLHLGEETSVLNFFIYDNRGKKVRQNGELVADRIVQELIKIKMGENNGEKIRHIFLVGDLFDLSLATFKECVENAQIFFRKICDSETVEEIVYIPGNHDHHIWMQIVEHKNFLSRVERGESLDFFYDRVAESDEIVKNTFLGGLMPKEKENCIGVSYPNYELMSKDQAIIFHHGHFNERLWTLTTDVFDEYLENYDLEELEICNSPLTEMVWYALGQAGRLGAGGLVEKIYTGVKNNDFEIIEKICGNIFDSIDEWDGRKKDDFLQERIDGMTKRAGLFLAKKVISQFMTKKKRKKGSLARGMTLEDEQLGDGTKRYMDRFIKLDRNYKYVFGHTHRHFQAAEFRDSNGFSHELVNCGGWVVEEIDQTPDSYLIRIDDEGTISPIRIDIPETILKTKYEIIKRTLI
jgi:UDP-2,3-diacylglucosamine pyrophosphatase LpxH